MATVFSVYDPNCTLLLADDAENQQFLSGFLPFIRTVKMQDDCATGYLCRDFTCQLPVTEPESLRKELLRAPSLL